MIAWLIEITVCVMDIQYFEMLTEFKSILVTAMRVKSHPH